MSEATILIEIQNKASAEKKVAAFFKEKEIEYDADSFESKKWAGRYRFFENPDFGKDEDALQWVLEITFTRKPMRALMVFIEPEIKKFFLGI